MRTILLLIVSVLLQFGAFSQSNLNLRGKLNDTKGNPVAGASVSILNSNRNTVSDSKGEFQFGNLPQGTYSISITSIGFASATVDVDLKSNSNPVSISLNSASSSLDAVVVSAQKKDELLQKAPLSVSALSAKQVKDYRLWQSNEITAIVPNLYSANSGDDRNVTSIRGITTTSYDPAVATYIDGVNQFGLDTYIANLIDVERIEVLRGPQGSLYGRNAMGGVINIITKQPGNSLTGSAEASIGNFNQQRFTVSIKAPLVKNKLFIGGAGVYQQRDGFYTNEFNNSSYDKQKSITGNYYLKYYPVSNWSIALNVKHHNNRNHGAFPLVADLQGAFDNPFKVSQNATAKMVDDIFNTSLSINNSGQFFNFSSQTAYQSNHRYYDAPLDGDFSPIDGITIINDYGKEWNKVKVFTQEFKFTSPASSNSDFKWTSGVYFFHQDNPVKQATHFGEDADMLGLPDKNFSSINTNKGKSTGAAIYGQVTYALNKEFELFAGLRFDYEKKKYTVTGEYQKDPDPAFTILPDTSAQVHYNAVSPRLGLTYYVNQNSTAYISFSRGFRAGGLTQLSIDPSQPPLFGYKPENSNNFEVGWKNNLWNNRIRLNAAVFFTKVNDVQVPTLVLPDAITVTRNAGKLNSFGGELELAITPVKNLQVDYNFGYTNAEYKELKVSQNGAEVNLEGKKQIFTPTTTSSLAAQYNLPVDASGKYQIVIRAEWMNIGKQYFDLSNNIKQSSYNLVNTKVGVSHKKFEIFFWGRNLLDEKYIAYAYDFGAVHLGNPATYGGTFAVKF